MRAICLTTILFLTGMRGHAEERIPLLSVVTEVPTTTLDTFEYSFTKRSLPAWAVILTTSAAFYHYDEDLLKAAKSDGRRWGLGNSDTTKTVVHGFGFDLLRLPSDTGSALYFLGDGWTHFLMSFSFLGTGYFSGANRPYNTGLEIIHGMITSTVISQALKRATGRESPSVSSAPRGKWRPFPSVTGYQAHTPMYDAFPSGHIMTATLTFTIINENYPEYFKYVAPAEALWLTVLGFQMMNNGVHWASDYPLGIGIGYAVGKMSAHLAQRHKQEGAARSASQWMIYPGIGPDGPELNALYAF